MSPRRDRLPLLLALLLALGPGCRRAPPGHPTSADLAVPYEVDSLDPHAADRLSAFAILFNAYEALVDADAELRLRPALATRWECPDPLTWIFHLRPGVTFHDGKPLRAADVVYSLERVRRSEELQVGNFARDIASVDALDTLVVRVRTSVPSRVLLAKLRHVAIVPEGSTAERLRLATDGTGPFAAAAWQPGRDLRLLRHEAYWGRKPALREVGIALGRGPEEAVEGLRGGRFQLVKCDSRSAALAVRFVAKARDSLFVKYLAFDLARDVTPGYREGRNPFRDVRVRRAVAMAIDRARLVSILGNDARVATQPISRAVFGFDPDMPEPGVDPEGARRLLAEAGFPAGFGATLHARPFAATAAPAVRDDLARVGIRAELRSVTDTEHFELLARKQLTLWITGIACGTGDASELFEDLIHTPGGAGRFGSLNDGGYSNPGLDAAIERSVAIEEPGLRLDAFREILRQVMADQVVVPLYTDRDVFALAPHLEWEPRADGEIRAADITFAR
ncbi:MAG TPA: ABC transporter substrate-binding protein [Vicinamibacteria bacterium]|nr:ABC transporter substrate-binding protein [Vicinamibacteria bacterium]